MLYKSAFVIQNIEVYAEKGISWKNIKNICDNNIHIKQIIYIHMVKHFFLLKNITYAQFLIHQTHNQLLNRIIK